MAIRGRSFLHSLWTSSPAGALVLAWTWRPSKGSGLCSRRCCTAAAATQNNCLMSTQLKKFLLLGTIVKSRSFQTRCSFGCRTTCTSGTPTTTRCKSKTPEKFKVILLWFHYITQIVRLQSRQLETDTAVGAALGNFRHIPTTRLVNDWKIKTTSWPKM
jgi:hypothetical protein